MHPLIDRHLIRDFLLVLSKSTTQERKERNREEQYAWLEERRDKNSALEGKFLNLLYDAGRRLPDRAQYRPKQHVHSEADFYYTGDGHREWSIRMNAAAPSGVSGSGPARSCRLNRSIYSWSNLDVSGETGSFFFSSGLGRLASFVRPRFRADFTPPIVEPTSSAISSSE
jgi:hypothetical protein